MKARQQSLVYLYQVGKGLHGSTMSRCKSSKMLQGLQWLENSQQRAVKYNLPLMSSQERLALECCQEKAVECSLAMRNSQERQALECSQVMHSLEYRETVEYSQPMRGCKECMLTLEFSHAVECSHAVEFSHALECSHAVEFSHAVESSHAMEDWQRLALECIPVVKDS